MINVCIQGLGFVGAAMAVAVANSRNPNGEPRYRVVGVDQPTQQGMGRIDSINQGVFPFPTSDSKLLSEYAAAKDVGNLTATCDQSVYKLADIVVVDVPLDIPFDDDLPILRISGFKNAIRTVGRLVPAGSLVLIETTVPPGMCDKVIAPMLFHELDQRGIAPDSVHLAHSFERVMPGEEYFDSIVNYWRAYAGYNDAAADACEEFLTTVVDTDRFPLRRLSSMLASETTKVMENTYRAVNIAFIDEWTKYAEQVGIDLYEVLEAIRVRSTHSNIRFPGLGVGGYCLTKDPAFAPASARQFYNLPELEFPFSELAIKVNNSMPIHTVDRLTKMLDGNLGGKKILILGISYRQDIGDTRYSPVEILVKKLKLNGATIEAFDPFIEYWPEMRLKLPTELPSPVYVDAVVFAIPHRQFRTLDLIDWLGNSAPMILDAANVITEEQRKACRAHSIRVESIGRADGL